MNRRINIISDVSNIFANGALHLAIIFHYENLSKFANHYLKQYWMATMRRKKKTPRNEIILLIFNVIKKKKGLREKRN